MAARTTIGSDPSRRVILVCADGYSSSLAAVTLRDLDRPTDVVGGSSAWLAEGLPVEAVDREGRGS